MAGESPRYQYIKKGRELMSRVLGERPEAYDKFSPDTFVKLQEQRRFLASLLTDVVGNPQKYPATDVLDAIRDKAKEFGLSFRFLRNKEANLIEFFVWDPRFEKPSWETGMKNPVWIGSAERGT